MPFQTHPTPGDIEDRILRAISRQVIHYNKVPRSITLPRMDYDLLMLMSIPNRLQVDKEGRAYFNGTLVEMDPRATQPSLTTEDGSHISF